MKPPFRLAEDGRIGVSNIQDDIELVPDRDL
jgi:hypothetical protein